MIYVYPAVFTGGAMGLSGHLNIPATAKGMVPSFVKKLNLMAQNTVRACIPAFIFGFFKFTCTTPFANAD